MRTAVPQQLGGRYEIGDLLGRAAWPRSTSAATSGSGRDVAIKMLRADLARDPTFQARFRREAQSAASLNHPAIVAVYDTGEDDVDGIPVPYIVMEYVDGRHAARPARSRAAGCCPERALEIVDGVLRGPGLQPPAGHRAPRHQAGQRDARPGPATVKVMDFGIARAMADASATMTQTAAVIGTAQYLSPEQARGEQVDARSDLYSTGCLLYELLTGRPPFVGDSPVVGRLPARARGARCRRRGRPRRLARRSTRSSSRRWPRTPTTATSPPTRCATTSPRALAGRPVAAALPPPRAATQQMQSTPAAGHLDDPGGRRRPPGRPATARAVARWATPLLALAVVAVFVLAALIGALGAGGHRRRRGGRARRRRAHRGRAKAALAAENLEVGRGHPQASDTVREGDVIEQRPGGRRRASTRAAQCRSPSSTGATRPASRATDRARPGRGAARRSSDAGLELGEITRWPRTRPATPSPRC